MQEWLSEWIDGWNAYHESPGCEELSAEEISAVSVVVPELRKVSSLEELGKHYASERESLAQLLDRSTEARHLGGLDVAKVIRMAYAVRFGELDGGQHERLVEGEEFARFGSDVKEALSRASNLLSRFRHRKVTVYHVLWSLLAVKAIWREIPSAGRLLQAVAGHVETIPSVPFGQYVGPDGVSEEVQDLLEAATIEAKRRNLSRVRVPLLLYVAIKTHRASLKSLEGGVLPVDDFERRLSQLVEEP